MQRYLLRLPPRYSHCRRRQLQLPYRPEGPDSSSFSWDRRAGIQPYGAYRDYLKVSALLNLETLAREYKRGLCTRG